MEQKINLKELIPNFSSISIPPETGSELSALFIIFLICIFIYFLFYAAFQFIKSIRLINWTMGLIGKETASSITLNREEFKEKSKKVNHAAGHLWLEFDETFIEVETSLGLKLHNTIEATHFFNTTSMAAGITESRMLAAVPGFLTAGGVIGTFVGLQLGLSELDISSKVSTEQMKEGVAHVISGAKIAFITSVWGVSLSVLFNILEKQLERHVRSKLNDLQVLIDGIFPRLSAENSLHRIANDGEQSRQSLQGLGERIGEKLQESLEKQISAIQNGLESSLQKIMAPAINKLVDETSNGNQQALEGLVEKFLDRFGELGGSQRDAMDQASHKVNDALSSLSKSMSTFVDRLEVSEGNSADREKQLITTISNEVTQLVEHSNEQKILLTEFVDSQLSGLSEVFQERERVSSEHDMRRQKMFIEQSDALKSGTEELLNRVERGLDSQLAASELLIEQGKLLQAGIDDSVKANVLVSENMKVSANQINSASQEIKLLGSHLMNAGNSLSGSIDKAVESTSGLAIQNELTSELIKKQREQLVDEKEQFVEAIELLQSLISSADSSFEKMREHQGVFLSDLKTNVSDLAKQMTNLLKDYATQANSQTTEHLDIWAKHSTDYAVQMNQAAQALSSVVDEIEVKLGK
jgi:hypothetical protein